MSEPSETQDFRGFYETSRVRQTITNDLHYNVNTVMYTLLIFQYWRLTVADNYGGPTTCLAEVQFFGVGKYFIDSYCACDLYRSSASLSRPIPRHFSIKRPWNRVWE
jgi:hypothetical protein